MTLFLCAALDATGHAYGCGRLQALATCAVGVGERGAARRLGSFVWPMGQAPARDGPGTDGWGPGPADDGGAVAPAGVLEDLAAWCREQASDQSGPPVLCGFAAPGDLAWLANAHRALGLDLPVLQQPLDLRSLAMGVLGVSWEEAAPTYLLPRLGVRVAGSGPAAEAELGALALMKLLERMRRRGAGRLSLF